MDDIRGLQPVRQVSLLCLDVLKVDDSVVLKPGAHGAVQGGGPPVLVIAGTKIIKDILKLL